MTQTQRKKALAEAEARLAEADAALKVAQDARTEAVSAFHAVQEDLRRNEPLTKAQGDLLVLIYTHDGWVNRGTWSGVRYWWDCESLDSRESIRESMVDAFRARGLLGAGVRDAGYSSIVRYPLSDWGKEVAERLAKASKPEGKG